MDRRKIVVLTSAELVQVVLKT